jgi:hypothetical protein
MIAMTAYQFFVLGAQWIVAFGALLVVLVIVALIVVTVLDM